MVGLNVKSIVSFPHTFQAGDGLIGVVIGYYEPRHRFTVVFPIAVVQCSLYRV